MPLPIVVLGAGPAGMASALALHTVGHDVVLLEKYPEARPAGNILNLWPPPVKAHALSRLRNFGPALRGLVEATDSAHTQSWPIRDRKPLKKWSKGRVTLAGDAAHATSPYAAYGAGMSIGDGYALAQCLAGVDLHDTTAVSRALDRYDAQRIPHTTAQVTQAYVLGQVFHHTPALLRPVRDWILDHTPLLQKQVGERSPAEIVAQLDEMGDDIHHPKAFA